MTDRASSHVAVALISWAQTDASKGSGRQIKIKRTRSMTRLVRVMMKSRVVLVSDSCKLSGENDMSDSSKIDPHPDVSHQAELRADSTAKMKPSIANPLI